MAKSKSPFTGSWHIVSMSGWEDEALNEEVQAFIEFGEEGCGLFQFGYVQGVTDSDMSRVSQTTTAQRSEIECVWLNSPGTEKTMQTARRWRVLDG